MAEPSRQINNVQELALWAGLTAVLAVGLVLYFRYADRIAPMLDLVTDR